MKTFLLACLCVIFIATAGQLTGCDNPAGPDDGGSSGGGGSGGGGTGNGGGETPKYPDLLFATIGIGNPGNQKCAAKTWTVPAGSISVSNSGDAPANPPAEVKFGIWDGHSGSWWVLWSTRDITNNTIWYPGRYFYNPEFNFAFPCGAPAGYYKFRLEVDSANRIKEGNESNNLWVSSFSFYLSH